MCSKVFWFIIYKKSKPCADTVASCVTTTLVQMLQLFQYILIPTSELAVSADFRDSPSFFRNKEFIEVLETSELSMLAFKNGGCFGEGMLHSLSVSMWTTSDMDGLTAREACVHKIPIWSTFDASLSGYSSFKMGSTDSVIVLAL